MKQVSSRTSVDKLRVDQTKDRVEDDDDRDDDDDEEDEVLTWSSALRQHWVAILVAFMATVVAFSQQKQYHQRKSGTVMSSFPLAAPTTNQLAADGLPAKHEHLLTFQRTSNITFCEEGFLESVKKLSQELQVMDFHVPKELIPTLLLHYEADVTEDDFYESVLGSSQTSLPTVGRARVERHLQVRCLTRLRDQTQQDFIKGMTFYYKKPSLGNMYPHHSKAVELSVKKKAPKLQPAHLTFTGFAAKFVNLSPKPVLLYWDGRGGSAKSRRLVGEIGPFEALGTATNPGQSFSVTPVHDGSNALGRWVLTADEPVQYYEPTPMSEIGQWTEEQQQLYKMQKLNQEFAKHYLIHSGRAWLGHWPRPYPLHFMWEASFFGQVHSVVTPERTFKLAVQSVTPRVFTIRNFLSVEECDKLLQLALQEGMKSSTVYSGSLVQHQRDLSTRSSSNTWLPRDTAELTDKIYRRAAQVLNIDESLLQKPIDDEVHAYHHSIAESLQVIHYKKGEQYTAHHDFVYPGQKHRYQPTRFATLLFYLNDDFKGGRTIFPRAVNAHFHEGVRIEPVKGMAVLFYNMLPDGNMDDLSQHGSEPVEDGDKFAANLWIWEPLIN